MVRVFIVLAFGLVISACGNEDPAEALLPSKSSVCGGLIKEGSYLIQWDDNSVSKIHEPNREALKENFIRPHLKNILRIEYDQKFSPQQSSGAVEQVFDNWALSAVQVEAFWQNGVRGQNITVAVIDSGLDVNHPKLSERIAANLGESGALANNGIDDDGNGFVDDHLGYNFYDDNNDLSDNVYHGTHVAGIIAAQHSHDSVIENEVLGLAPAAQILPLKFIDQDGGSLSDALRAMEYAAQRGARVINASWGGSGCSDILRDKIQQLSQAGILFVAASGNSGRNLDRYPEFPAAFTDTEQLTVGAISPFLGMTNFSNYSGRRVHLFAPGQDIVSTAPRGQSLSMSGTSMAAPFVAGAAALIWSQKPSLSLSQVRTLLLQSVVEDPNYINLTRGRIDLRRAHSLLQQIH